MDLERVEKKLREATFFLSKMVDQGKRASGERKPFDFYLSAFLNAARSIDYRLRHEQKAAYEPWREKWNEALTPDQSALVKYLIDDRNVEVHESGSKRSVGQEEIKFGHTYSDMSGTHEVFGPADMGPATIYKPT
jgi:hypothetical protein